MNLWHRFPNLHLIGSFSLLGVVGLNYPTLAVALQANPAVASEVLATDVELQEEISPTAKNAGDAFKSVTSEQLSITPSLVGDLLQLPATSDQFPITNVGEGLIDTTIHTVIASDSKEKADELQPAAPTTTLETPLEYSPQEATLSEEEQVTSVTQLSDVRPTDWAFEALRALIERYGVIAGYPDGTFRGNRAMTRYEFAAALNVALERINQLTQETTSFVTREDLEKLQRLQEEFATELTAIRGRVDKLETRTAQLEDNLFSTTTKLTGQVIFAVTGGGFNGDRMVNVTGNQITTNDPNTTFIYRAALDFNTSFRGTDLLKIRLDTGSNGPNDNAAGFLEPSLGSVIDFSAKPPVSTVGLARLFYTFSPFKDLTVSIGPRIAITDYVDYNRYANLSFLDFSTQALINNYILIPVQGLGAGAAVNWNPGKSPFTVRGAYVALDANNPNSGSSSFIPGLFPMGYVLYPNGRSDRGLFGDSYQGLVELQYSPNPALAVRLQYTGGNLIDRRFDVFGANVELAITKGIAVFGRYGYGSYDDTSFGDINPQYWMAGIAFPNLFMPGAISGIAVAQPFIADEVGDATQTNFEAFYNFPVRRGIQITPLVQVIVNPGNQDSNGTIFTGTLRTVFSF